MQKVMCAGLRLHALVVVAVVSPSSASSSVSAASAALSVVVGGVVVDVVVVVSLSSHTEARGRKEMRGQPEGIQERTEAGDVGCCAPPCATHRAPLRRHALTCAAMRRRAPAYAQLRYVRRCALQ